MRVESDSAPQTSGQWSKRRVVLLLPFGGCARAHLDYKSFELDSDGRLVLDELCEDLSLASADANRLKWYLRTVMLVAEFDREIRVRERAEAY